jgi:hypothetical protein
MNFRLSISSAIAFITVGLSLYAYNPSFFDSITKIISILHFSAAISLIVGLPTVIKKEESEQTSLAKIGTAGSFAVLFLALSAANLITSLYLVKINLSLAISVLSLGLLLFYLNSQGIVDTIIEKNKNDLHETLVHLHLRDEILGFAASCKDSQRKRVLQKLGDDFRYLPNLAQTSSSANLSHAVQTLVENAHDADEERFSVLIENVKSEIDIFKIKNSRSIH